MSELIKEILTEIKEKRCILFLGSGSTVSCESPLGGGLLGSGLAQEMAKFLGEDISTFSTSLMEASEYIEAYFPQHRNALDDFIYDRLHDLRPTIGHLLLTMFPWASITTTNYNRVIETGFEISHNKGITQYCCVPFRTDEEIETLALAENEVSLYKPHGCVTLRNNPDAPMVLTAKDYYYSTKNRRKIYEQIREHARQFSTLFIGYSLVDYNFNNIYYELQETLGDYLVRSYSVIPISSHKAKYMQRVYQRRSIELLDDKFDTFMISLCDESGNINSSVMSVIIEELSRPNVIQRLGSYANNIPQSIKDGLTARGMAIPADASTSE